MAGTAVTKKAEQQIKGGVLQFWTFSVDPASIAAAAQGIETVAIPGARAGDQTFVNARAPEANLIVAGSKVTADDVVSVYLDNNITVTTALDGGAIVYDLQILKFAGGDALAA
jgi:hypothetical protein